MQVGILAAVVLVLTVFSNCFAGEQVKLIKIGIGIHNLPPGFVVSADGSQCGGGALDKLNKVFLPLGYKLDPICGSSARIYRELDNGGVDLSISTRSNNMINKVHTYITPAYTEVVLVLYNYPTSILAPDDNSVAAIRGYDYQGQRMEMQQQGFQFVDMPDSISAADFFLHKRSQYLISYEKPFLHYLKQHNPELINKLESKQLSRIDAYLVISIHSPHKEKIIKIIQDYAKQHQCIYFKDCVSLP